MAVTGKNIGVGGRYSGDYTPTITFDPIPDNIDSVGSINFNYKVDGDWCFVFGVLAIDPTATATNTQILIELPVLSNLSAGSDCVGSGFSNSTTVGNKTYGLVIGDTTTNQAKFTFEATSLSNLGYYLDFKYRILQ